MLMIFIPGNNCKKGKKYFDWYILFADGLLKNFNNLISSNSEDFGCIDLQIQKQINVLQRS